MTPRDQFVFPELSDHARLVEEMREYAEEMDQPIPGVAYPVSFIKNRGPVSNLYYIIRRFFKKALDFFLN